MSLKEVDPRLGDCDELKEDRLVDGNTGGGKSPLLTLTLDLMGSDVMHCSEGEMEYK